MKEKTIREQLTLTADLRVGTSLLKAGVYEVKCDSATISFTPLREDSDGPGHWIRMTKDTAAFQCKGAQLSAKREKTELTMSPGKDGVLVLDKLYLKGSNVEHVFN